MDNKDNQIVPYELHDIDYFENTDSFSLEGRVLSRVGEVVLNGTGLVVLGALAVSGSVVYCAAWLFNEAYRQSKHAYYSLNGIKTERVNDSDDFFPKYISLNYPELISKK